MAKYQQDRDIAWRQVDGEAVLVDPVARLLRVLNPSGCYLWAELEHPRSADELVELLAGEFDVTPEAARKDVEAFLGLLKDRKLVKEVA